MTINNDFNKIQINETIEKSGDSSTVLRRSLMLNIRANSVAEGIKLYEGLKKRLNGEVPLESKRSEKKNGKAKKEKSEEQNSQKEQKESEVPVCPECKVPMLLRRSKNGSTFFGCPNFPLCRKTAPLISKEEKERLEHEPADQDLVMIEG